MLCDRSDTIVLDETLVGCKEKCLVLSNRTTNREAELVLLQLGSQLTILVQKKVIRIQSVIAEELP